MWPQRKIKMMHRMKATKTTLWNPGCDHAGIATQRADDEKPVVATTRSGKQCLVTLLWLCILTRTDISISMGTGCKRHNLPFITIFDDEGNIVGDYGNFTGMKRFHVREGNSKFRLKKRDCILTPQTTLWWCPICSQVKDAVEPMLKLQWYVKCGEEGCFCHQSCGTW
ncbi:hypothetical protein NQ317_010972 [Molorchus minor]|uniref:valine--tRNA ligase n=1 Tax=Molorchus minor TaxID=1323400 RepID=A0ABQ9J2U6_9CUCU|nr:hypothetical protein NQ317_010972 [Molorchus minor]